MKVYKFSEVIKYFKSQSDLARILNVSRQAVSVWKSQDEIPLLRAYELEEIFKEKGVNPNIYDSTIKNNSVDYGYLNSSEVFLKHLRTKFEKELREKIEKELREKIKKEYVDKIKKMLD